MVVLPYHPALKRSIKPRWGMEWVGMTQKAREENRHKRRSGEEQGGSSTGPRQVPNGFCRMGVSPSLWEGESLEGDVLLASFSLFFAAFTVPRFSLLKMKRHQSFSSSNV